MQGVCGCGGVGVCKVKSTITWEMVQLVKCLLHKYENLIQMCRTHIKAGQRSIHLQFWFWKEETSESMEHTGSILTELTSPRFRARAIQYT